MFVKGFRGVRGLGDFVARTPQDWKMDNWIGQPIGGGLQVPVAANGGSMVSTTEVAVGGGLGLAALAAAAWWYFSKK